MNKHIRNLYLVIFFLNVSQIDNIQISRKKNEQYINKRQEGSFFCVMMNKIQEQHRNGKTNERKKEK